MAGDEGSAWQGPAGAYGERTAAKAAVSPGLRLGPLSAWLAGRTDPLSCRFRSLLELGECCLDRAHLDPGHATASAWVACPEGSRLLLIRHRKLGRWLQPGGHIEGADATVRDAAVREAREETGLRALEPLCWAPFDVDIHLISATPREPKHLHFDVRFAFQATGPAATCLEPDLREVADARWVPFEEVARFAAEESVLRSSQRLRALLAPPPGD